jgi:hypothetical protein
MRTSWIVLVAAALAACADNNMPAPPDSADVASMVLDATTDATPLDVTPDRAAMSDAAMDAAPDALPDALPDVLPDALPDVAADVRATETNCSNGADDDRDGVADCADSDCVPAMRCVPAPAAGWAAPGELRAGATPPACAAPYDTEAYLGHAEPLAAAATCSACSCGAPTRAECRSAYVCERTSGCAGLCSARSVEGMGCVESANASGTYLPRNGLGATGTCGAGTSTATLPAPRWGRGARLCTAAANTATGCPSGQVCVARPASPAPACIVRTGDVACPAEYSARQVLYGALDDSRRCSACVCAFTATSCTVSYVAFSQPACAGTGTALTLDQCYTGDPASYRITHTVQGAACAAATAGAPIGAVSATMPSTVCCTP